MPRTTGTVPTAQAKDRFLEAAIFLMRQSGLSGAGINQLITRSGAPKGSVYYHFPGGKQQIIGEALTIYGERVAAAFERALSSRKKTGDKIRALFRFVADRFEEGAFEQSCAAGAVTLDLDAEVVALRPVIAAAFVSWRSVIANHQSLSWRPANGLLNSPKVIPTIFREQRIRAADALRRSRLRPFWRGRNSPSRRYPGRPSRRQPSCETIP